MKASILSELDNSTPASVKNSGKKGSSTKKSESKIVTDADADATDDEEANILQSALKGRRGKAKASTVRNKLLASQEDDEDAMKIDDKIDQAVEATTSSSSATPISAKVIEEIPKTNTRGGRKSKKTVDAIPIETPL
jgi:hypothetical protein